MSDQVFEAAIKVERFEGFGMVTIRGDFSEKAMRKSIEAQVAPIPETRGVTVGDNGMLAWMSPDEVLAVLPAPRTQDVAATLEDQLAEHHALVVNVSDARSVFRLSGSGAREVLAKGAPVDLSRQAFGPGEIRRTRLGQVACAFWMSGEDQFDLVCFRSVSDFVFDWLKVASRDGSLPEYL